MLMKKFKLVDVRGNAAWDFRRIYEEFYDGEKSSRVLSRVRKHCLTRCQVINRKNRTHM